MEINSTEAALIQTPLEQAAQEANQAPAAAIPPAQATQTNTQPELYEVKYNGQTIKVPLSELQNGYSRQQDYTQKTMKLSEERQRYEQELTNYKQREAEITQFLSDPRVQNALRQLQAGVTDPKQPLTVEQAQQFYQSQAQQQQRAMQEYVARMAEDLEMRQLASQYTTDINSTINNLLDKHEVLKDIDGIEELLKRDVAGREPANLQQAKQFIAEAAQARAQRIESRFQTQQKQAAVQAAQLSKGGIEVGGQAPAIVPPEKKFKLGSSDLFQTVVADLTAQSLKQ